MTTGVSQRAEATTEVMQLVSFHLRVPRVAKDQARIRVRVNNPAAIETIDMRNREVNSLYCLKTTKSIRTLVY